MSVANVDRSLAVLEVLAQHARGLSLGALATTLGIGKSALHRLLQTLAERGYVQQDALSQDYALSLKLALLGFRYLDAHHLPDVAQTALDRLAADSGEYVRIALVDGDTLAWVACAQGATAGLRYEPSMGREVVLHATATGKAWLATLSDDEALARVRARGGFRVPAGFGPRVIRSAPVLRQELAATRRRGHALAIDEGEPGTTALAATFRGVDAPHAPVIGTVSIAGPTARLDGPRVKALVPRLAAATRELTGLWPVWTRQHAPRHAGPAMRLDSTASSP
ncbi:MAG: IclR family transcriptional regulator [Casimicrobiaceae bacterium]